MKHKARHAPRQSAPRTAPTGHLDVGHSEGIAVREEIETQLIESIRSGKYSERELINLHNNASSRGSPNVAQAVVVQMRADYSRAANRLFGAKEKAASAMLEEVIGALSAKHDLSGNCLKNAVRAGTDMGSGKKYIDVYYAYKNSAGVRAYLGLIQDDAAAELTACVRYYKAGETTCGEEQKFVLDDFGSAVDSYTAQLVRVLPAH